MRLKNAALFSLAVLKETPSFLRDVLIGLPLIHLVALIGAPRQVLGILFVGPLVGISLFLLNPKSMGIGLLAGLVASIALPALPLLYIAAIGLSLNILTGTLESLIVRTQNHLELAAKTLSEPGHAQLNYYGRKDLVEEKFPGGLGPIPKALFYNFRAANYVSSESDKPYNKYADTHHIPENFGGLKPIRSKR